MSSVLPYLSYFINELCSIASEAQEDLLFIALDSLQQVCLVSPIGVLQLMYNITSLTEELLLLMLKD